MHIKLSDCARVNIAQFRDLATLEEILLNNHRAILVHQAAPEDISLRFKVETKLQESIYKRKGCDC